ncbi:MAG: hypothetical protein ACXWKU_22255, partial [Caulobacteraceae bacterium]
MSAERMLRGLLEGVGVGVNGPNPWDIQLRNGNLFDRVMAQGSLGFGEAYMDGWWDCAQLDELFARLTGGDLGRKIR